MDLNLILRHFQTEATVAPYGNGHINDTYCADSAKYILQRINTKIFTDIDGLMENIENVTAFLRKKVVAAGGDPERETLSVVKTTDGKNFYKLDDNNCFRVYKFITGTKTVESEKTLEDMYRAGRGFGRFQNMLSDFPVDKLNETIKDFHNTPKRVEALKKAIEEDKAGRAAFVKTEIDFALKNAALADVIVKGIEDGSILLRVTHNDTKINNILFDAESGDAICVIDLDTVMPGSMLYDFGDALRMGASTGAEDETDLAKVWFDVETFKRFAEGYLEETLTSLTDRELELMPFSVKLMAYECGVRFLTDYLNGDTYFKIHSEHHNLVRVRNHFKLVEDIAKKEPVLSEIIKQIKDSLQKH